MSGIEDGSWGPAGACRCAARFVCSALQPGRMLALPAYCQGWTGGPPGSAHNLPPTCWHTRVSLPVVAADCSSRACHDAGGTTRLLCCQADQVAWWVRVPARCAAWPWHRPPLVRTVSLHAAGARKQAAEGWGSRTTVQCCLTCPCVQQGKQGTVGIPAHHGTLVQQGLLDAACQGAVAAGAGRWWWVCAPGVCLCTCVQCRLQLDTCAQATLYL